MAPLIEVAEAQVITEPKGGETPPGVGEIADLIYKLESSSGKNDQKCERLGKHNGYGYSQGVGRNFCLDSDDAMRELVVEWIKDKQSKGMSENTLLCYYNTGIVQSDCDYIR